MRGAQVINFALLNALPPPVLVSGSAVISPASLSTGQSMGHSTAQATLLLGLAVSAAVAAVRHLRFHTHQRIERGIFRSAFDVDAAAGVLFVAGCVVSIALRFHQDNPSPAASLATFSAHAVVCMLFGSAAMASPARWDRAALRAIAALLVMLVLMHRSYNTPIIAACCGYGCGRNAFCCRRRK